MRGADRGGNAVSAPARLYPRHMGSRARDNRHLYEVMMSLHAPEHDATFRQSLWTFTVEQVQRIAGSDRAAHASVALWAFLHRAVALEAAQVFGASKPASGLEFGLDAWLLAVSM